jgi:hypothetical protein
MTSNKERSILVVTPAYGGLAYVGYISGLLNLERVCREKNIKIDYEFCYNESLIPRARNTLTDLFYNKTDYTHLLFLDADIQFDGEDIIKMLDYDKPLVGGVYPKKSINWEKITELVNKNNENELTCENIQAIVKDSVVILLEDPTINLNDDFIETKYAGTGILLIQRIVLDKMRESFPNDVYTRGGNTDFFRYFDTELKDGIYLSEDYWFCDRWRQLGGKVYLYTKFRCRHWGTYAY